MAIDSPKYQIWAGYDTDNGVTAGSITRIDNLFGLRFNNPSDINYKYNEAQLAQHEGSSPLMDGNLAARDIILSGQWGLASYPHDLLYAEVDGYSKIKAINDSPGYLKVLFLDSGGFEPYRYYCKFLGVSAPRQPKTQHMAQQSMQLNFRHYDPGIYRDSSYFEAKSVVSGIYSGTLTNTGGLFEANRLTVKITKSGADNPTNVAVSIGGEVFVITGSLTAPGDYWFIDCNEGWVQKNSEVRGAGTDEISKFSGKFIGVPHGTPACVVIDNASSDFLVVFTWLYRYI